MKSKDQIVKGGVHFLIELIIVFIGVYLAFLLNEYRADNETQNRRQQMRSALFQEIGIFISSTDAITPFLDSLLTQWQNKYIAGERPIPLYLQFTGVDLPPRGMWQAVVSSDGLSILNIKTIQKASDFYNSLDVLVDKYKTLNEFAERELLPNADFGSYKFYKKDNKLNPEFNAYMQRVRDLRELLNIVRARAVESRNILME